MNEPKKAKLAPVRITHDYWDEEGVRHAAGGIVEMPAAQAKVLLASGKGERADPLPGEDE